MGNATDKDGPGTGGFHPGSFVMHSRSTAQIALFGIRNGAVWVADDVIVTRSHRDVLVERLAGSRIVAVLVRHDGTGMAQTIWAQLNDIAVDVGCPFEHSSADVPRPT